MPGSVRLRTVSGMRAEILPFTAEHVPAAAQLLAERHRRHRVAEPLLSPRFEDPVTAEAEVSAAFKADGASGAVAVRDGAVIAYVVGSPKNESVWGPNIWVESAGQATGPDDADAEVIRDVYAVAATRWVEAGHTEHYVMTPAHDQRLTTAWFQLGFGHQHTHAVRENAVQPAAVPGHLEVRPAERQDIPMLARLEVSLPQHQGLSPCFSSGPLGSVEESAAEWEDDWDNPDFPTWVAVHDGEVVGSAVGCAVTKSKPNGGLIAPDNASFLGFAAVLAQARGLGAGRALGETVLHWSGEAGYDCVTTDWRQTNLLSSRAWPALGFRPTFARLHRTIGR